MKDASIKTKIIKEFEGRLHYLPILFFCFSICREEFASDEEAEQLDDFARPLTSGELRTKVIKGITKRDIGATGGGGGGGAGANTSKQPTAPYQPKKNETLKKTKK